MKMSKSRLPTKQEYQLRYGLDFSNNGKCSKCGECCGSVLPLTKKDFVRIGKFVKPLKSKLIESGNKCIFRQDGKCLIYAVRPFVCRVYHCNYENGVKNLLKFAEHDPGVAKPVSMNLFLKGLERR